MTNIKFFSKPYGDIFLSLFIEIFVKKLTTALVATPSVTFIFEVVKNQNKTKIQIQWLEIIFMMKSKICIYNFRMDRPRRSLEAFSLPESHWSFKIVANTKIQIIANLRRKIQENLQDEEPGLGCRFGPIKCCLSNQPKRWNIL